MNELRGTRIAVAVTGSFCTFDAAGLTIEPFCPVRQPERHLRESLARSAAAR